MFNKTLRQAYSFIRTNGIGRRYRRSQREFSASAISSSEGPFDILFCGSDGFSVASLKAVKQAKDIWKSIHVLTPGERRVRKRKAGEPDGPPLHNYAEQNSLPSSVVPLEGISAYDPPTQFSTLSPSNVLLTASFGHIIPNSMLSSFEPLHRLNVHPSILPRYRGAAPIQWTIINGDTETGVSVQTLVDKGKGIDSGDIVSSVTGIPVPGDATYQSMLPVLAETGGQLLVQALRQIRDGIANPLSQDSSQRTKAPKITHEKAGIDWTLDTATYITRLSRAISHQYPLWTTFSTSPIQLINISPKPVDNVPDHFTSNRHEAGTAYMYKDPGRKRLLVACSTEGDEGRQGWIEVGKVKAAARKEVEVGEWWNGLPDEARRRGWIKFG